MPNWGMSMKKKTIFLIFVFIVATVTINCIKKAQSTEVKSTYGYLGYQLYYEINSTAEVSMGETINFKVLLSPDADIDDVQIYLSISGAGVSYQKSWVGIRLSAYQTIIDTALLEPSSNGEVRCQLEASYLDVTYGDYEYGIINTTIAIVRNLTYSQLSESYDSLNEKYQQLDDQLYFYRNLTYLFVAMVVIIAVISLTIVHRHKAQVSEIKPQMNIK